MVDDIRRRVDAGESDAEIRQAYVDRYSEQILLKPRGSGFGALVWALPVVVLVLGGGGLAIRFRRWRLQPALAPTQADPRPGEQAPAEPPEEAAPAPPTRL